MGNAVIFLVTTKTRKDDKASTHAHCVLASFLMRTRRNENATIDSLVCHYGNLQGQVQARQTQKDVSA